MRCDGAEVARLRRELGITQMDLADKAKVSKTTIERIERGIAVDYQSIHQIAPVLGVGFNDLIRPEGGDTAGPEAAFVPLTSLGSARELMDLLLRCDTAALDLVDDPAEDATLAVIVVLQKLEALLPGNPNTEWDTLRSWRTSAAERLRGVARVNNVLAELAAMGLHLLIGEYVAHLNEEEAEAAAQNYVDELEVADFAYVSRPQQPDYRKRVAMLRVAKRGRTQMKVKAEDMAGPDAPSPSASGSDAEDVPF